VRNNHLFIVDNITPLFDSVATECYRALAGFALFGICGELGMEQEKTVFIVARNAPVRT